MVKTNNKHPSIKRKQIKKSFISVTIANQLAKIHKGKRKVVKITKKIEIPSIPKEKFKLDSGIHKKSQTN